MTCAIVLIMLTACNGSEDVGEVREDISLLEKDLETISITEMKTFNESVPDSTVVIDDQEDVETMQSIIGEGQNSRQPSISDVIDPDYEIEFGKLNYYVWLSESGGSFQDQRDNDHIYPLYKVESQEMLEIVEEALNE
ncbi:hypothetical protein [Geomicrobium sediminis]|uniref:YhfM-like domain-containing protein n=1 Tax=Geomicrobium sediminis TaxID=1347788 RepID=A0ABS2PAZ8_9BACL|nr:hypothetical protein [Geomicrobium sediminis]MBM7632311.1 hypothetical protein [Geomicrobium sediminis]